MEPQIDSAKRFKLRLAIVATSLVWLALSPPPHGKVAAQEPARPKGVLVLYSNEKDSPSNVSFDKSFHAAFSLAPAGSIEYYAEYLGDNRFSGENQFLLVRDFLRQRYGDNRIEAIIAPSPASLNFLLKYRSDLFPNTPIVFHAFKRADIDKKDEANGVPVLVDSPFRNTVDLALKLNPVAKQAFVIARMPGGDKSLEAEVRNELKVFDNSKDLKLEYLSDRP